MRTFKLTLAYDGTRYHGWQAQPRVPTVEGYLLAAWQRITGETPELDGSSRTDAGVHALGQVASVRSETKLSPQVLRRALTAELPDDVVVLAVEQAGDQFHAIRDTLRKRYRYWLYDGQTLDPFWRKYCWHVRHRLDEQAMQSAAQHLVGRHDFLSFETQGPHTRSSVRTIFSLQVVRGGAGQGGGPTAGPGHTSDDLVMLEVSGDGFLYNMVRSITGTLVEVGRGRRTTAWVAQVVAARNRRAAGMTAPAQGLFLVDIDYPPTATVDNTWTASASLDGRAATDPAAVDRGEQAG